MQNQWLLRISYRVKHLKHTLDDNFSTFIFSSLCSSEVFHEKKMQLYKLNQENNMCNLLHIQHFCSDFRVLFSGSTLDSLQSFLRTYKYLQMVEKHKFFFGQSQFPTSTHIYFSCPDLFFYLFLVKILISPLVHYYIDIFQGLPI